MTKDLCCFHQDFYHGLRVTYGGDWDCQPEGHVHISFLAIIPEQRSEDEQFVVMFSPPSLHPKPDTLRSSSPGTPSTNHVAGNSPCSRTVSTSLPSVQRSAEASAG